MDYLHNFDKIVEKNCLERNQYKKLREKRLVTGYTKTDNKGNVLTKTPITFRQYNSILDKYGVFEKVERVESLNQIFYNLMNQFSQDEVDAMVRFINRVGWDIPNIQFAYETLSGKESKARDIFESILELLQYYVPPPTPPPSTPPSTPSGTTLSLASTPYGTRPPTPTPPDDDEGILGEIAEVLESAPTGTFFGGVPELPTAREIRRGEIERAAQERLEGRPTQLTMTGFAGRPQSTLLSGDVFQLEPPPVQRFQIPTISQQSSGGSYLYGFP